MKQIRYLLVLVILLMGPAIRSFSQIQSLPEIIVLARNYKYLRSLNNKDVAQPVRLLERKAAAYDVRNSEYYEDDYDSYSISFYLPEGYILATYDSAGKLIRTAERFKNVALPAPVKNAVVTRYPNWSISNDTYVVKYENDNGAQKNYKLVLHNGNKRLRVKINDRGEFMD